MKFVGLTGGIGSGKTSVLRLLGECGAVTIDIDQVHRTLQEPGVRRGLTSLPLHEQVEPRQCSPDRGRTLLGDATWFDPVPHAHGGTRPSR